jgi:alkylation response protein AidB-like acyl-CoA dehydrogenase
VLSRSVPAAVTRLFDALGASATDTGRDLDRHWRNARTAASHNPWVYKARIVGDRAVNGVPPLRLWAVGRAS